MIMFFKLLNSYNAGLSFSPYGPRSRVFAVLTEAGGRTEFRNVWADWYELCSTWGSGHGTEAK